LVFAKAIYLVTKKKESFGEFPKALFCLTQQGRWSSNRLAQQHACQQFNHYMCIGLYDVNPMLPDLFQLYGLGILKVTLLEQKLL